MGEKNAMFVGTYPFNDWFGLYDPSGSGSRKVFTIYINSRRINDAYRKNCSSCWQNFVKSVTVHELGHGLSLANDPQAPGKPDGYYLSIMDTDRPRNSMIVPQSFDRQNVSAKYSSLIPKLEGNNMKLSNVSMPALVLAVGITSGCVSDGSNAGSSEESIKPSEVSEVVTLEADVLPYKTVEDIAARADALVELSITGSRDELMGPDFSSDDPKLNPYAGSGETPSDAELARMQIAMTVYKAKVINTLAGDLSEGQTIEVVELGGSKNGIDYNVAQMTALSDEVPDIMFISQEEDGRFSIVGMEQGKFNLEGSGKYVSMHPEREDLIIENSEDLMQLEQVVEE